MKTLRSLSLALFVTVGAAAGASSASAQVYVDEGVDIGPEPACPYGYYEYAPYPCAPYGYYGAEWFAGGIFVGAGPWFRGPRGFRGHVDPRFDPRRGYARPCPRSTSALHRARASTAYPTSTAMNGMTAVAIRGMATATAERALRPSRTCDPCRYQVESGRESRATDDNIFIERAVAGGRFGRRA
jgi:hypothetical protein